MKTIKVIWKDAQTRNATLNLEEIKETSLAYAISIGYLVDKNKERIAICPFIFPNELEEDRNSHDKKRETEMMIGYRDTHFIPKSQIIKIINLKEI